MYRGDGLRVELNSVEIDFRKLLGLAADAVLLSHSVRGVQLYRKAQLIKNAPQPRDIHDPWLGLVTLIATTVQDPTPEASYI